jgi:hypothetical protein
VLELTFFFTRLSGGVFVGIILLKFAIDGVRGSWWLRRNRQTADPDVFT